VDDVDAGGDRFAEVVVVGSGSAVKGDEGSDDLFDFGDSWDVEVFGCFAVHHAF